MSDVGCMREETNLARALVGNAADRDLVAAHWRRRVGDRDGDRNGRRDEHGKNEDTNKKKAIPLKKKREERKKKGENRIIRFFRLFLGIRHRHQEQRAHSS